jgi:hypothetical protein
MYTSGSSAARASPGVKATGLVNATAVEHTSASEDSAWMSSRVDVKAAGYETAVPRAADSARSTTDTSNCPETGFCDSRVRSRPSSLMLGFRPWNRSPPDPVTTAVARSTSRTTTVVADPTVCSNAIRVPFRASEGLPARPGSPALTSNGAPSRKGSVRGSLPPESVLR